MLPISGSSANLAEGKHLANHIDVLAVKTADRLKERLRADVGNHHEQKATTALPRFNVPDGCPPTDDLPDDLR
jgi:hypothetical protein